MEVIVEEDEVEVGNEEEDEEEEIYFLRRKSIAMFHTHLPVFIYKWSFVYQTCQRRCPPSQEITIREIINRSNS
jgi:hypothetical protein